MISTARISSSNGYNRFELLSLRLSRFLLKLNDFLFSLSKNILGIIGLIIIIPILFLLAIIGWFLMLGLNYSLERDRDEFNTLVNTWDERRKMEELLKLEGLVNQLASAMKSSQEKKFIINPVTKQSLILLENLRHLENTLKDVAYPELNKELSEEDKLDLFNLFGQTTDPDWKNSEVISYSK